MSQADDDVALELERWRVSRELDIAELRGAVRSLQLTTVRLEKELTTVRLKAREP